MIKAQELRIGNWVIQGKYGPLPVDGYNISRLESLEKGGNEAEYYKEFKPIPLTPEILERSGFENVSSKTGFGLWILGAENVPGVHVEGPLNVCYIRKSVVIYFGLSDIGTGFIYGRDCLSAAAPTQYVHQLQNLYYALTGEELEINL